VLGCSQRLTRTRLGPALLFPTLDYFKHRAQV
jgi:hypothetical protein